MASLLGTPQPAGDAVLWAERAADRAIQVVRQVPGGTREVLASVPAAFAIGDGAAQGELVRHGEVVPAPGSFALSDLTAAVLDQGRDGRVTTRAIRTVRLGDAVLARCEDTQADRPAELASDGTRVAFQDPCDRAAIVVVENGAQERIATGMPLGFDQLRIAGRWLAWAPFGEGATAVLYDRVEHRVVLTAVARFGDQITSLGLQDDGTLLVARSGRRFLVYTPADPQGRPLDARRGDRLIRGVALAGGRVAYLALPRRDDELRGDADMELVTGDLAGRWSVAARFGAGAAASGAFEPFGFDGTHLVWPTLRCTTTTIDTAGETAFPGCGEPTIPVQRVRVAGGRLVLRVSCPRACRGRVSVSTERELVGTRFRRPGTVRAGLPRGALRRLSAGRPATLSVWIRNAYYGSVRLAP